MADKETMERISELFKGFADPTRVHILSLLQEQELCVSDIAAAVECDYPELKKIADIVTCKCDDGAIADLIKKLEERINKR